MRVVMLIVLGGFLAGCGVDGAPIKPSSGVQTTFGFGAAQSGFDDGLLKVRFGN